MDMKDDMLIRVFEGEATREELLRVRAWVHESEEHRAHFELLRRWWNVVGGPVGTGEEERAEWRRFRQRTGLARRRRIGTWRWAAAAVAVVMGVWFVIDGKGKAGGGVVAEKAVEEEIVPGSFQAVLTLASGEKVALRLGDSLHVEAGKAVNGNEGLVYGSGGDGGIADNEGGDEVVYNEVQTPYGGEYTVRLSDGSLVYLNAGSRLRYPVAFGDGPRVVELTGEGYFEVARDEERLFVVRTGEVETRVYGTKFDVNTFGGVRAVLVEGRVGVRGMDGREHRLCPSQLIEYDEDGVLVGIEEVDTRVYLAWKEGYFFFDDECLDEVLETLGRWYNVSFSCEGFDAKALHFTGHMEKYEDINVILGAIHRIAGVQFDINGRHVHVRK